MLQESPENLQWAPRSGNVLGSPPGTTSLRGYVEAISPRLPSSFMLELKGANGSHVAVMFADAALLPWHPFLASLCPGVY